MPDISWPFQVMTDALLAATGAILMQANMNRDLSPCAYHSQTFSSAKQNYDIYDWKMLAILHELKEWHYYLTRTTHAVTIIMDHKSLGYFQ